jgi:hypothetical protein
MFKVKRCFGFLTMANGLACADFGIAHFVNQPI